MSARLPRALLLLAALSRAAAAHSAEEDAPHSHERGLGRDHWTYKALREWDSRYPDCGGAMQSPININTAETVFSPQLRPIQLAGYSLSSKEMLKLKNNGHTVVLELPELLAIAGGYAQQYKAVQLHLHWGSPSGPGSEHTVDNHRFPAEIHVVHYNTKYDNFKEAMVHPDGLAVLGAFLQVGPRENPYYQQILEHLYKIEGEDEEVFVPGFNIAGLLPANLNLYFQYNGSLTTPACYQTVKWTVFNQTVQLSQDQISLLVTTLRGDDDSPLQNNFRGVQKLHGRHVLASFQTALPSVQQLPPADGAAACAEKHSGSFQAGDVLAVLFGVLFAVTALAFLLYIHKQRTQNVRLDNPTKSKVIYTAATTEENAV
ncbi:carbonic anhydrase 9 [Nothoprocta perdicaria]|uniref:carbonic anhydrase 9 n=1 Tax=Nothoprocta perdicaria TaxID=30464 RepID=UPI000E1C03E1|nr:carbonic anhydrase 9 [Nothoprocta perdicaria]